MSVDELCVLFRLEGIAEEALIPLNEHAVDDPEEVARMVEMSVLCSLLTFSFISVLRILENCSFVHLVGL